MFVDGKLLTIWGASGMLVVLGQATNRGQIRSDWKMAMSRAIVRDEKIIIKLSAEKKGELQAISEQMGVSMSAIGAYIIGQWLMQQQMINKPLMEKMNNLLADTIKEMVAQGQ
jgi:hypothetical protein